MLKYIKYILKNIKYNLYYKRGIFFPSVSDSFYTHHQNIFRGPFDEIVKRQKIYVPYIKKVPAKVLRSSTFLDCGFGRGEFLELLKKSKTTVAMGIDTNAESVKSAKKSGLNVIKGDAIKYLYLTEKTFSGISAFHLIEHLAFPQLFDFLILCHAKLAKKGILILETPNINNMLVSSKTFYYDPTHIQKITPELLNLVLKTAGFSEVEFLHLHPAIKNAKNNIEQLIYSAQDLGIVAYK